MAVMVPNGFPHDLRTKPRLAGEKVAFETLRAELGQEWWVFYDRAVRGTARRVDFVGIDLRRGVVAIEVKGGLVHASRGAFRQLVAASGRRKRIDPFEQLKMAFARVCDSAGVEMGRLPVHFVIWFPQMGQGAFTWPASAHFWTREMLERGAVREIVERALPIAKGMEPRSALEQLACALGAECERPPRLHRRKTVNET